MPKLSLSLPQALFLGNVFWAFYSLLYPWLSRRWLPPPLILPAEVYKVLLLINFLRYSHSFVVFSIK